MIVTVASFKGGVGKTMTAIHLAAYMQQRKPTLLIDGDPNRSASKWEFRGNLPFKIVDERGAARHARDYEHIVIDTQARPEEADLRSLADGCDLLVIPSTPDAMALDALFLTVEALQKIGTDAYRVLLTIVPPRPNKDGDEAQALLRSKGMPLFKNQVHRLVAFQKAALAGIPVYAVGDPRAKTAWADYEAVGKEILR